MDRRTDIAPVVALPEACVRWAMLVRNGYRLSAVQNITVPVASGTAAANRIAASPDIALEVSDVDEAYRRVVALGIRTTCPPKLLRGGMTKVIYVSALRIMSSN